MLMVNPEPYSDPKMQHNFAMLVFMLKKVLLIVYFLLKCKA